MRQFLPQLLRAYLRVFEDIADRIHWATGHVISFEKLDPIPRRLQDRSKFKCLAHLHDAQVHLRKRALWRRECLQSTGSIACEMQCTNLSSARSSLYPQVFHRPPRAVARDVRTGAGTCTEPMGSPVQQSPLRRPDDFVDVGEDEGLSRACSLRHRSPIVPVPPVAPPRIVCRP